VIDITLHKAKYRRPGKWVWRTEVEGKYKIDPPGTKVYTYFPSIAAKQRTNPAKGGSGQSIRARRKAYGPF
jgi:hypothetical protein